MPHPYQLTVTELSHKERISFIFLGEPMNVILLDKMLFYFTPNFNTDRVKSKPEINVDA